MRLTVGTNPVKPSTFSARVCADGNMGAHVVSSSAASSGLDRTGASASVTMAGCVAGSFVYSPLANPVSLQQAQHTTW